MTACSPRGAGEGVAGVETAAACLRVRTLDMVPCVLVYRCVRCRVSCLLEGGYLEIFDCVCCKWTSGEQAMSQIS